MHKSGFVNIIGRPNVGKSTLMNALVGERMSIITNKPQTTRHRIIGILSTDAYQIVFSDTPGVIQKTFYKMQDAMNRFALSTFEDADVMLFVTETAENYEPDDRLINQMKKVDIPLFLVINKSDAVKAEMAEAKKEWWLQQVPFRECFILSALQRNGTPELLDRIVHYLPEGPEYYPKDQLTDRPERFFVGEIIREKILELYEEEIPYSCEVIIESFKETNTREGAPLVRIAATIYVSRKTQKPILIGKDGAAIKKLGTRSRETIEQWLEQKVFLELHVKVRDNWRDDDRMLQYFGYD